MADTTMDTWTLEDLERITMPSTGQKAPKRKGAE